MLPITADRGDRLENTLHTMFAEQTTVSSHLSQHDSDKLCREWVGQLFFSAGSSQSKGLLS